MTTDHDPGDADADRPRTTLEALRRAAEHLQDAHPEHHLGEVLAIEERAAIVAIVPVLARLARRQDSVDFLIAVLGREA